MKTMTMLEFRRNALAALKEVARGQRILLTYRGKAAVQLVPPPNRPLVEESDPFYQITDLAVDGAGGLTNEEIKRRMRMLNGAL